MYGFQPIKIILTILLQFKWIKWDIFFKKKFAEFILSETYSFTCVGKARQWRIKK